MRSVSVFSLLFSALLLTTPACESTSDSTGPAGQDLALEDRLQVSYDESLTTREVSSFSSTPSHSIYRRLLEEKGYSVWLEDAAHYKAVDPATGKTGHMTVIPCSVPGDSTRIAMIKFFRDEEGYAVTAAEYFEYEDYDIPHPVDERALASVLGEETDPAVKLEMLERSETAKRYWQCVTTRFVSGCAGCATVCWITGPAWGACTAKCCAGSMVVALVSCAFVHFLGW